MANKVGKRGDTLVEVMLAVGIFSMVAVAVVAVMSGGTSSSQTALETTLAREEIDTQAESLRFIHRAYVADTKSGTNSMWGVIWNNITENAIRLDELEDAEKQNTVLQYNPGSCDELYQGADEDSGGLIADTHGFVINPQRIAHFVKSADESNVGEVVVRNNKDSESAADNKLQKAATYPHLIFGTRTDTETELIDRDSTGVGDNGELYAAEGIYVMAVADNDTTTLVGASDQSLTAYYDFYIRTCWYGTGDQSPSTISTVMRLYNPDIHTPVQ